MSGIKYYIIDLESSGLSASYHEVCEVSIIRCEDRVQLTEFIKCDAPERASLDALRVCNKTLADLSKGKSKEEVVEKINKFINADGLTPAHRCFVAHNYSFDKKFIHALYDKVGQKFCGDLWMCTMALSKQYAKDIGLIKPKVNLHACLDMLQIKKIAQAHASQADTRNTYFLWKNLVEDKKMDYLRFIKQFPHVPAEQEEQGLDPDDLDIE